MPYKQKKMMERNYLQKLMTTTNIVTITKKFMNNKKQQWGVDM
jgi:hypothetical protein